MMRASIALALHDLRVLRRDPVPLVLLFALPIALAAFLEDAFGSILLLEGQLDAKGAQQVIPGMAVMFSFFLVGLVGLSFFREHGWGTWQRLRATPLGSAGLLTGKLLPLVAIAFAQMGVLFGAGFAIFGLELEGSAAGLVLIAGSTSLAHLALGLAIVAYARTLPQVNAFANLGAVVTAGLGGAIVPLSTLPDWARTIAPITPAYWAMEGFRTLFLEAGGLGGVLRSVGFLLGFATAFTLVAAQRLQMEEPKGLS